MSTLEAFRIFALIFTAGRGLGNSQWSPEKNFWSDRWSRWHWSHTRCSEFWRQNCNTGILGRFGTIRTGDCIWLSEFVLYVTIFESFFLLKPPGKLSLLIRCAAHIAYVDCCWLFACCCWLFDSNHLVVSLTAVKLLAIADVSLIFGLTKIFQGIFFMSQQGTDVVLCFSVALFLLVWLCLKGLHPQWLDIILVEFLDWGSLRDLLGRIAWSHFTLDLGIISFYFF